jgi:hypothetical protein
MKPGSVCSQVRAACLYPLSDEFNSYSSYSFKNNFNTVLSFHARLGFPYGFPTQTVYYRWGDSFKFT